MVNQLVSDADMLSRGDVQQGEHKEAMAKWEADTPMLRKKNKPKAKVLKNLVACFCLSFNCFLQTDGGNCPICRERARRGEPILTKADPFDNRQLICACVVCSCLCKTCFNASQWSLIKYKSMHQAGQQPSGVQGQCKAQSTTNQQFSLQSLKDNIAHSELKAQDILNYTNDEIGIAHEYVDDGAIALQYLQEFHMMGQNEQHALRHAMGPPTPNLPAGLKWGSGMNINELDQRFNSGMPAQRSSWQHGKRHYLNNLSDMPASSSSASTDLQIFETAPSTSEFWEPVIPLSTSSSLRSSLSSSGNANRTRTSIDGT